MPDRKPDGQDIPAYIEASPLLFLARGQAGSAPAFGVGVHAMLGGGCPRLPTNSSHSQRNPDGLPSGNGAMLGLVLAVFLVGFPLHLFETGVVIGKLVEMSESDFAGDDRIVARHVC